ncbi:MULTISPECIES: cysteine hydrolase family protein [Sediminibacillus]|uniref:cysteine hydrolase family protein n=1 Tax=Sediminibacillus TaxID=482460 RepID=UPI00129694F2|nr:isochorismatase family cysteine hydrolase [Sediminibacillus terrae]
MSIEESALVLIDLQKEGNFGLERMDKAIRNTQEVIQACRENGIPIIYTRQINRADGIGLSRQEPLKEDGTPFFYASNTENIEIVEEVKPLETDIVIDKHRWSAFFDTNLDIILRSMGVKNLIVGGVVTDGCLLTSVFDAYFRDYNVHLVKDMCAASNEGAHMASLMIMANWVYNLKVYNTPKIIQQINGDGVNCWESNEVDSLQFTPENMRQQFAKLPQDKGE